jgi:hypothetical protein
MSAGMVQPNAAEAQSKLAAMIETGRASRTAAPPTAPAK